MTLKTALIGLVLASTLLGGCRSLGRGGESSGWRPLRRDEGPQVRNVVCLFDQRPWVSADASSDRDPEGLQYRVFLDTGEGKAELREGMFHVEMYQLTRDADGKSNRELVSDWHYPSSRFTTIQARIMGNGYRLQLHWARKDLAGSEIELVTKFEDKNGHLSRSDTKRLRIPKYTS